MTLVRTLQTRPNPDGTRRPLEGFFIWTPTERRIISGSPDEVVQPAGFAVELKAGAFEVDVAATGTDWVWRVDERLTGLRTKTSYVVVPEEGPVDFTDLAPVNVSSLKPSSVPDHIWYVYTDHLAEQARLAKEAAQASEDAAVEAVDSAAVSATLADERADSAGQSAFNAAQSAAAALGNKNAAANSEAHAVEAASAAYESEVAAELAMTAAQQARNGVEAVRDDAELIELNQIHSGTINNNGDLILTKRDGTTINAGRVVSRLTVGTVTTGP
ncbi:hypothetical protein GORDON_21 [Arthrobacter phage Gordon]|uniref:Tail protein n=1 Tax=Arthrobacter phage Gordon TaxID=1772298 RepID=A0A0U4JGP3_9CAUD|nr:tail protein [Arthrobacter phage Gordon]ALY08996.1 hypothetical protein GORDON_21 [Arthrobacter phage Gordon]